MCVRVYMCMCAYVYVRVRILEFIMKLKYLFKKKINVSETFVSVRRPLYHPDSRNALQRLYLKPRDVFPCVLRAAPALDI